jgi:hypothetical protein
VTCAYFAAAGFTETSHAAVISKYGKQAAANCYPPTLALSVDGASARTYSELTEWRADLAI